MMILFVLHANRRSYFLLTLILTAFVRSVKGGKVVGDK